MTQHDKTRHDMTWGERTCQHADTLNQTADKRPTTQRSATVQYRFAWFQPALGMLFKVPRPRFWGSVTREERPRHDLAQQYMIGLHNTMHCNAMQRTRRQYNTMQRKRGGGEQARGMQDPRKKANPSIRLKLKQSFIADTSAISEAAVLDAFCPHMGAHLGFGGEVVGNSIKCPFHGWSFDREGKCQRIPYTSRLTEEVREGVRKV